MSQVEVRPISGPELHDVSTLLRGYAFWPSPPLPPSAEIAEELAALGQYPNLALFEDNQPMAVVAYMPMTQNVRGKIVPSAGVWGVATHPAGRRKGYARQALFELLKTMRSEDYPFTTLYPFKESFYERLGYVTFPRPPKIRFGVNGLTPLLKRDFGGKVELQNYQDHYSLWRTFHQQLQTRIPGMALISDKVAEHRASTQKFWLANAQVNGETVGMMSYQLKGDHGDMIVSRFYYSTVQGLYLLLEWIARHADQASTVEIKLPPGELPETWLSDLNIEYAAFDAPMARLLDISKLDGLGLQVGEGRFSAKILDPQCPWNEGIFTFEGSNGELKVSPAEQVDCELSVQALTGLIFGTHRPEVFAMRGWGNPNPTTQAALSALFPPQLPYLHEVF